LFFGVFSLLKIDPKFVAAVRNAGNASDLHDLLQNAVRLEHSTIPPYLTAAYSIKRNSNSEIFQAIRSIAQEEMLHMAMVCNVLTAIGGHPKIADAGFVPTYPGHLPMSIGGGLVVGLRKFSLDLVKNVFMEIEKPENPLHFPVPELHNIAPTFATIGQFYTALIQKITELGDGIFTGDPGHQVVVDRPDPWQHLQPITNVETATAALEWIVEDGEGTKTLPFDGSGELAHYYRFEEIFHGRRLIEVAGDPGFAFAGDAIPLDETKILDLPDNPKAADYAAGSPSRQAVDIFNQQYSDVLRALQIAFDGAPDHIGVAQQVMVQMRTTATQVVTMVDPATGKNLGLTYEFMPQLTS
jgi:rubrerythrin